MSTLEEMGRDLERAIELEDHDAAMRLAKEMDREASALGFEEMGQELIAAMQVGNYASVSPIARWLGRKGGEVDKKRGEVFGHSLTQALEISQVAQAVAGRAN